MIDVEESHVERDDAQLEGQTGNRKTRPKTSTVLFGAAVGRQALADTGDFQGSGGPVDHRHAVEEQAGCQGAQDEATSSPPRWIAGIPVHRHLGIENRDRSSSPR